MKLSPRIHKIAELINYGDSVADIGTDHGYAPMLLVQNERTPRVIMTDISEASLSKAIETFKIAGLLDKVPGADFRTGDGLSVIEPAEVDEIIIAGLGGHTISEILSADEDKSHSFSRLVLQPRKHSGTLRYFLCTHGWEIESENLALEGKFACEIITAIPQELNAVKNQSPTYPEDDIRWKYPVQMAKSDPALAKKRIDWKINSIREQLKELKRADSAKDDAREERRLYAERIHADLEYLEDIIYSL